jgi:hypothetical protein
MEPQNKPIPLRSRSLDGTNEAHHPLTDSSSPPSRLTTSDFRPLHSQSSTLDKDSTSLSSRKDPSEPYIIRNEADRQAVLADLAEKDRHFQTNPTKHYLDLVASGPIIPLPPGSNAMAAGFAGESGDARRHMSSSFRNNSGRGTLSNDQNQRPVNNQLCRNGPQCRKFQEGLYAQSTTENGGNHSCMVLSLLVMDRHLPLQS